MFFPYIGIEHIFPYILKYMLQSAKNGKHIFSHFPTPDPWRIGWRAAPGWSLRPNTQRYLRRGATWVGASWSHPGEIEAGSYWLDYMTIWAIDNGTYILSQLIKWIYDWIISYSAHWLRRNRWAEWSRCTWIATIHQAEITSFGDSYPNPISIIPVASRHPGSFGVNWSSLAGEHCWEQWLKSTGTIDAWEAVGKAEIEKKRWSWNVENWGMGKRRAIKPRILVKGMDHPIHIWGL